MSKLMPVPYKSVESIANVRRRVFCKHYDTCLDYAIKKRWSGFACDACEGYERERFSSQQMEDDFSRCMELVVLCNGYRADVPGEAYVN